MIQQIKWPSRSSNEPPSPFGRGNETRPIRITLHSSSFDGADEDQMRAIELLREMTKLTAVELIDTQPGHLPYLDIEDSKGDGSTLPFTVKDGKNWKIKSGIPAPEALFKVFASSVGKSRIEEVDRESAYQDFLVAQANYELGFDILITLSPYLLGNRENRFIRSANLRTPLEAVKIIGLLVRMRGGYLFGVNRNYFLEFDRRSIYKELLRNQLPNLSYYIRACAYAESFGANGITYLAESALVRCTRALQARDEIGALFYRPQSNESRDAIMYHFDYLALLLAGAFDAQARIARLVYEMRDIDERNAGFHLKEFKKAVRKSDALELYKLITNQQFLELRTMLHDLRNSIHAAIWPTIASENYRDLEESFIKVPVHYQEKLWRAALRRGSPNNWGLVRDPEFLLLEPYTYAVTLVKECFREIDEIATLTDVKRLLPDEFDMTQLRDKGSHDKVFLEFVPQRVELLD
jgi:hypothetical protein